MTFLLSVPLEAYLLLAALIGYIVWEIYQHRVVRRDSSSTCNLPACQEERRSAVKLIEYGHTKEDGGCVKLHQANATPESTDVTANQAHTPAPDRKRLRDLGVTVGVLPCGKLNAITDVPGVRVGHTTLKSGDGALQPGVGPVRTGVTVILPHSGDLWKERVSAASFVLNGNGAVTGLEWVRESGFLEGPLALTNTHSVGDVYRAMIRWMVRNNPGIGITEDSFLPVVGECDDSALNDIQGFHVKEEHVISALDKATSGAVVEGAVGAGTGMSCYDFKGGIGTSSRLVTVGDTSYTIGVLVNANHGDREQLLVDGVAVGRLLEAEMATVHREGSICIVVATDAPLSSRQLERIAKRAALGLARTGATANDSSGDFIVAFSNTRKIIRDSNNAVTNLPEINDSMISPLFKATAEATEEAVLNALCMAETTVGRDGNTASALPLERLRELLVQHGRIKV